VRTFALVPAAGKSVRMGVPKPALPLGNRSILEHVIAALRLAGVEQILVVVGPHNGQLGALAESAGACVLVLEAETPDMRRTVESAFTWIQKHWHPGDEDYWLLVPADHPTLDADIVRRLLAARSTSAHASILIPTYEGKRGHPTLIRWNHVAGVRAMPAAMALNAYLREHAAETFEVAVSSAEVLQDMDTPEDYQRLQQVWTDRLRQRARSPDSPDLR
jgi:molybdenum cofactor cytidylyltransferase